MEELEAKLGEIAKAFADFKTLNDQRIKAIESKGFAPGDLIEKNEKANAAIERLQEQYKAMETAMARSNHGGGSGDEGAKEATAKYAAAFKKWTQGQSTDAEFRAECKAMSVDSDVDGGFLVTPEVSNQVVKKVFESSPMRQLADVTSISTDSMEIFEDLDEAQSGWVGEIQARTETGTPQIKKIIIPVHELSAMPKTTQKLLDDAAWNVEAWLSGKVSEKFGRDENTAFVIGNGVNKPKGILSYDAGTGFGQLEQIPMLHASQLTADGLIDVQNALFEAYQPSASWMMKRQTVKSVRKLKDSQGRYLWEPSLVPGNPDMLLGKAIYQASDMQAESAGNLAVAYGDFKAGYQIIDRIGIRVLRDPYTAKGSILFYTTKRVGGGVKNFQAIKLGKVSAS